MRILLIGSSVLFLTACLGGSGENLEVRNGPQAENPLTGEIENQTTSAANSTGTEIVAVPAVLAGTLFLEIPQ